MDWANPQATDATTKMPMDICSSSFLLNRSASFPQIGVEAVEASSIAVTTQVYCDWVPLREPMICGRATETTVLLIIATNSTMSRPLRARITWRWSMGAASVGAAVCALTRNLRRFGQEWEGFTLHAHWAILHNVQKY